MKRLLIWLLVCLGVWTPAAHADEWQSVQQLHRQAAAGWHQTIQAGRRTVVIDIDIDVPDVQAAPVLRIARGSTAYTPQAQPDELLYIFNGGGIPDYPGCFALVHNAPDGEYFWDKGGLNRRQPTEWKNAYTQVYIWLRPWDMQRACTQGNPYPLGDAVRDVQALLDRATDRQLQFSLDTVETVGIYSVKEWTGQTPILGELLAPEYYRLKCTQHLRGLPLLRAMDIELMNNDAPKNVQKHAVFAPGDTVIRIASASSYSFGVRPVHETAVLHDDIPLCPLATIQQSIEKLIVSGHLRSVHSLRFGLVAYDDPDSADGIIAMPAWVVKGNYYRNPAVSDNPWNSFTPDGKAFIGGANNYLTDIVINAQTGRTLIDLTDVRDVLAPEVVTKQ